jgi:glycosyltransferase involved in cell wall biosynthesis
MTKKRILYIESNTDGTIGGSYYSLLYLLQGLNREKYEPIVLFCENNILIPRFERFAERVIVHNYGPAVSSPATSLADLLKYVPRFIKYVLMTQKEIGKIISDVQPDLIHLSNGYDSNHGWVLASKLRGLKVVAHDRGVRPPFSAQTRIFVRLLDAIIAVSDDYLSNIRKYNLKTKRARRVYNGLDPKAFTKRAFNRPRADVRKALGIDDDEVLIGMIGNIIQWKGQHVFAEAAKAIIQKQHRVKGIIIGDTPVGAEDYAKELREFIVNNKMATNFTISGFRNDIPELLNAIDIFVHASVEPEPFARVILEAMACGKPIVATNCGGTSEQIIQGESGILVPPNDPRTMAEKIEEILLDQKKANTLGEKALLRLEEKFSIKNMVDGVERIYSDIFSEYQ